MTCGGAACAAGSARTGAALGCGIAFFSRIRKSPWAYSNSSSPCSDMKESKRSSWPRSTPGTEKSGRRMFFRSLHRCAQSSRNSRGAVVRISAPRGVTKASSSMRIPPTPSTYTPGSKVMTFPVSRTVFCPERSGGPHGFQGQSRDLCYARNSGPTLYAADTFRAAASTAPQVTPDFSASLAADLRFQYRLIPLADARRRPPTWTVRVKSLQ